MPAESSASRVRVAAVDEQHAAIALALRSLPAENRGQLLDAVGRPQSHPLGPLDGLVVLERRGRLAAAAWAQPSPGKIAALWPPEWRTRRPEGATADEVRMLRVVTDACDAAGVGLIQALLEDEADPRCASLAAAGFRRIATLEYLGRSLPSGSESLRSDGAELRFESLSEAGYERLKRVVQQTYEESLDCPGLGEARRLDDVLTGYRATGSYDPENWLVAADAQGDVGVLILAEHPASDQAELVYMGLSRRGRGRGLGKALVAEAVRRAAAIGAEHLMVAVDRANTPAKRVYEAAGFVAWTQRLVLVRSAERR